MQRRNVDFPDPDGPMMQTTWPGCTCRSMPLSTSVDPKDLCTCSDSTIASGNALNPRSRPGLAGWLVEAAAEALLQEVLADHQHARQGQVPQARRHQQGEHLEGAAADGVQLEEQLGGHRD